MTYIISVDTSTSIGSVALHSNGELQFYAELRTEKSHSENLAVLINDAIQCTNLTMNDIDAFAICSGPGSYTGLRIGVSTIKGLCFATDKPLIAINAHQIMANMFYQRYSFLSDYIVCPMLDARRLEVYAGLLNKELNFIETIAPHILSEHSYVEQLATQKIAFVGNSNKKTKPFITSNNALFIEDIYPSAQYMGNLAFEAFQNKQFENVSLFEPFYLKEFQTNAVI